MKLREEEAKRTSWVLTGGSPRDDTQIERCGFELFVRSRTDCFNAGRFFALPILLSFFIIQFLLSAPPGGSVSGISRPSRQTSRLAGFEAYWPLGSSRMGNLCCIRPEVSLPDPFCPCL